MIIFKLISVRFKQNLRLVFSYFYFKDSKQKRKLKIENSYIYIYIYCFLARSAGLTVASSSFYNPSKVCKCLIWTTEVIHGCFDPRQNNKAPLFN